MTITIRDLIELHDYIIQKSGGATGIRDHRSLESAIHQPFMSFGGEPLFPDIRLQAVALCFYLVTNHPFIDGNKRIGHAAMLLLLKLNGFEFIAPIADQEKVMLDLAAGLLDREEFSNWALAHIFSVEGA
ncbi:MAG: type II toxin-antitoxin system death-on-curing family toxin [Siphonobacter aquaeclarae]|nr:type II toxin-antitoxin system death-on-curing family toxin [Siphonobacter aquaeclarae]